jgi:hypothetical protein
MRKLLFIPFIFFVISCANKVPPSGGDKDVEPPVLVSSDPEMFRTQFKGREFTLEFDELFDLENISTQLVVSPMLLSKPKVKMNRNRLTVSFYEENLKPNTTYNFNFGNAIKDHNEGNILKNFAYIFSTGDFIDSLFVSGKIIDAYTKEPIENVAVMLYDNHEDSLPLKAPPTYFDISDENGDYIIANIKEGVYKFFALEDLNQNYIYDQPSERIGFIYELIDLEPDSSYVYNVPVFQEDNKLQFVTKVITEPYGFITIVMNKPFGIMDFKTHGRNIDDEDYKFKLWPGRDTLQFWFPDYKEEFILEILDDSDFSDSIDVKITPVFELEKIPVFSIKSNVGGTMDLGAPLIVEMLHPLSEWTPPVIKLWEDSMEVAIDPYIPDSTKLKVRIDYPWKEKSKYNLIIGLGAFVDMYDQKNDVYELKFGAQEESYYGVINLNVNLFEREWPYILEMFGSSGKTINSQNLYKSEIVVFPQLQPGEYGFRIIEDVNENGKWDPGNYELGFLSENIFYFKEMVKVRSNWEMDQTWNISTE